MAEMDNNMNPMDGTENTQPEQPNTDTQQEDTKAFKAPERKKGFFEGVVNFAKMIFVTPFALIARIAQRIALGKEGAQKADEAAEKEYAKNQEMKLDRKTAVSMEQDAKSIIHELQKDPEYVRNPLSIKDVEVYVPDTGREELRFAINVTLQNDTTYNATPKDYSMYINDSGQLMANKTVPPEVIAQVKNILNKIHLDVRDGQETEVPVSPESPTPESKDEPKQDTPQDAPQDAPQQDETPEEKKPVPLLQTTYEEGKGIIVDGTYNGHSITMTSTSPLQATFVYNNETYTCTYEGDSKAISIAGNDLSKLGSEEVRVLIAQASHKVFEDVIHEDWTHGPSGYRLTNGGYVCTTLGTKINDALQNVDSIKPNALYIVPDLAVGDMIIDVQYAAATRNGQLTGQFNAYPHFHVIRTADDGTVSLQQAESDKNGKSPSNLKFSSKNSSVALSSLEVSRRLAFAYAQTANMPEMQVLSSGHALYVVHESSQGPSVAVFSGYCVYDKAEIANETLESLYQHHGNEGTLENFSRAFVTMCECNPSMNCYGMHNNIMYHVYRNEDGIRFARGQELDTGVEKTFALESFNSTNPIADAVQALHGELIQEQNKEADAPELDDMEETL